MLGLERSLLCERAGDQDDVEIRGLDPQKNLIANGIDKGAFLCPNVHEILVVNIHPPKQSSLSTDMIARDGHCQFTILTPPQAIAASNSLIRQFHAYPKL